MLLIWPVIRMVVLGIRNSKSLIGTTSATYLVFYRVGGEVIIERAMQRAHGPTFVPVQDYLKIPEENK